MRLTRRLLAGLIPIFLAGCVTFLDATHDKPIETDPGKRTFGQYMDDERLETIVSVNLRKINPELADAHVNAYVFNGVVLLTGEVPSKELRQLAGQTARKIHKVRQVHNELLIKSNSSVFSRSNDNWVATKLRTKLLANKKIDSERVKIVVENRIVYLMGLLTQEEADLVSDIAAHINGVEKVVRVIEYVD